MNTEHLLEIQKKLNNLEKQKNDIEIEIISILLNHNNTSPQLLICPQCFDLHTSETSTANPLCGDCVYKIIERNLYDD